MGALAVDVCAAGKAGSFQVNMLNHKVKYESGKMKCIRGKKNHIEDINKGSQGLAVGNTETSKVTRHTSLSKQGKACEVKHETMRNYSNSNKLETKHKVTLLKQKNKTQVPYSLVYTLDKSPVHGGAGWKFSFTLF